MDLESPFTGLAAMLQEGKLFAPRPWYMAAGLTF